MNFISSPLAYQNAQANLIIQRNLRSEIEHLDNLIELIAFTPRGSFIADPEFGFEYWNHEYSNIQYRTFNSGQGGMLGDKTGQEVTKLECQESIRQSLQTYAPQLTRVNVAVELNAAQYTDNGQKKKVQSKHLVSIVVEGEFDSGVGTSKYKKKVEFLMEPTAKKHHYF
jgi:hypothetical protein